MKSEISYFIEKANRQHPFILIDVGAAFGIHKKWDPLKGILKVIAFEPDPREFAKLQNTDTITFYNYIIHSQSKDLTFFITEKGGHSSLYRPNPAVLAQFPDAERYNTVEEKHFPAEQVRSLDDIVEENTIRDVDFIDLSTAGTELAVLEGSQHRVLPQAFGIFTKAYFLEKFKNQPFFRDVDRFLNERGFQLIDMRRTYWKRKDFCDFRGKGQLERGDCLYLKKIDTLAEELSVAGDPDYCASKIYKCILACLIYKTFDYAVSLAQMGREKKFLTAGESEKAIFLIKQCAQNDSFPNFKGKAKVYGLLNRVSDMLKPPSYLGWADADRHIGNIREI